MGNDMRKIAILGCTSRKRDNACTAVELYQASSFFRKILEYANEVIKVDEVFILSAKHNLIPSTKVIEPYNVTLIGQKKEDRMAWANTSLEQILEKFDPKRDKLYLFCGKVYYEFILPSLIEKGFQCEIPLEDKGGIGKQLQWLDQQLDNKSITPIQLWDI